MATINQLPLLDQPNSGDQIPVWSPNNGDSRRLPLSALLAYFQQQFAAPTLATNLYVPATGFSIAVLMAIITFSLVIYVFCCFCFKRICEKAGHEPGILIWIPIANLVPLLTAAKLPIWLIVLFFIPFVNIVAIVFLYWKLCEARSKPGALGLLILVPVANLGLILYLAFAD